MNKSMIREIFNGEKGNQKNMPDSLLLNEHIKEFWEYEDLLKKALNDEQKAMLKLYNRKQCEIEYEREILAYCEGLKTGIRIGIECMEE